MTSPSRWDDLGPRLASAAVLIVVAGLALASGDPWVSGLACIAAGLMTWEAARMTAPGRRAGAALIGVAGAVALATVFLMHSIYWMGLLAVPAALGLLRRRNDPVGYALVALAIMLACYALVAFRSGLGLGFVLWIFLVVFLTDTLGYFGGRLIGGPKFWPAISPKKTWSGTIAGWAGAALAGAAFWIWGGAPFWIVPFSVLVSFAGQMGDIAESALKRRAGQKDASHLIPGHGGVMDRLDALSGAALFLLGWGMLLPLPQIGG